MHALIVVAHPDPGSLTHAIAAHIAEGVSASGQDHTTEIADLTAEGFDPRFTRADRAVHHRAAAATADVLAEQARIDRSHALVLVYPVFWWSMPGLLKGWIDRVFSNGWAFDDGPGGAGLVKRLGRLGVVLIGVAGADDGLYARHGYDTAIRTQIDHGIFDYCGARVLTSDILTESETQDAADKLAAAVSIGRELFLKSGSGGH